MLLGILVCVVIKMANLTSWVSHALVVKPSILPHTIVAALLCGLHRIRAMGGRHRIHVKHLRQLSRHVSSQVPD